MKKGKARASGKPEMLVEEWGENPERVRMAVAFDAGIRAQVPLAAGMACLEFGCGRGNLALLLPEELSIVAIDTSEEAIEALRQKTAALNRSNISAHCADIMDFAEERRYDLIYSTMALHHIREIGALLRKCARLLAVDGVLMLADLEAEDGSFHDDRTGVYHFGFDRLELAGLLAGAGFEVLSIGEVYRREKSFPDGSVRSYPLFMAIARPVAGIPEEDEA